MTHTQKYYEYIVDLIIEKYKDELANCLPGHCIKITGLGKEQVLPLLTKIRSNFPKIDSFILSDNDEGTDFVSPTKLVELRNIEAKPLLVVIPATSRTAAEDSFGNATFKDISLQGIDADLLTLLLLKAPPTTKSLIENVFNYLGSISLSDRIQFLLGIEEANWEKIAVGENLNHLGLIPDAILSTEDAKIRARLNFNNISTQKLSDFNRTIFERIKELPLERNSIQKDIVSFFKSSGNILSRKELVTKIKNLEPKLNFANWPIPDLNVNTMRLNVEEIKSSDFKIVEGVKCLHVPVGKSSKAKIRITTTPTIKDIQELEYFRLILMASNGAAGEFVQELKKIKNSTSRLLYKDLNFTIDANILIEGTYFIKVLAEDANNVVLNSDDRFKDDSVEKHWQDLKVINPNIDKNSIERKLTCDSEDFYLTVTDEKEEKESVRKDKLNNVFQAYFKFRIDQLKNGIILTEPVSEDGTNQWIGNPSEATNTIFHVRYDSKHDYQINLSGKLYQIERLFIKYSDQLGRVIAVASNNPSQVSLSSLKFESFDLLNQLAPLALLNARKELFEAINNSAPGKSGVLFTTSINEFYVLALTYLDEVFNWTNLLREKFKKLSPENIQEAKELHILLLQLQSLDITSLQTRLDDNRPLSVKLLSPLHPLRLAWFLNHIDLYSDWEGKTVDNPKFRKEWFNNLNNFFLQDLTPENNPLILLDDESKHPYQYAGELSYGWGVYLSSAEDDKESHALTSINRQIKTFLSKILNINKENRIDNEVSETLIIRHLKNYISQHPYTDCLVINIFNAGDAIAFSNALIDLESDVLYKQLRYEIRLFKGDNSIIDQGEGLKNLLNPEFNVSEEAEAFSQPSSNRLFPKLRFSINSIREFLVNPDDFSSHISFLISPFPSKTELFKPTRKEVSFFLNGLIVSPAIEVTENGGEIQWNKFIYPNKFDSDQINKSVSIFESIQIFVAGALASKYTEAIPATSLLLREADKVLINNIHDYSDWVVTFDRNLGPEVYDLPGKDGEVPFLLDYIPGEEITGVSSYLTTRPTSEIVGLLGPHFKAYDIPIDSEGHNGMLRMLLEDLRAISSSLVMQLNSGKNKAFEVVGAAFTKRVLEKKGILTNSFLIPIDLHQNLFAGLNSDNKSRADHLLVKIDTEKRSIDFTVIEVKCRKSLSTADAADLKDKMKEQMDNTILALKEHFDPQNSVSSNRLDRTIKNKELKSLLEFYIFRAIRYQHLSPNTSEYYLTFVQSLDSGFQMTFRELGLIYDFSSSKRHHKEEINSDLTYFTFGSKLISEILNPDSDLNTKRLEKADEDLAITDYFGSIEELSPFIQKFAIPITEPYSTPSNATQPQSVENLAAEPEIPIIRSEEIIIQDKQDNTGSIVNYPIYDTLIGKTSESEQFGIIGKSIQGKSIAIDANETNTISLFGVQGGGKSYTIGTITEMMLKQFPSINKLPAPLSGVIFHYSETMDYSPEATSMIYSNDKEKEIAMLKSKYGADPDKLDDIILFVPADKIEERRKQFSSIEVKQIAFNSKELNVQDWMFLLGAIGNDATYVRQLKAIMREIRTNITITELRTRIDASLLLTNAQRALAQQRLNFASHYIDDSYSLKDNLKPGRLLIIDLRDEFIERDEALGLFVIMLNIFSGVREVAGKSFNKFIVFDEAHKYMGNKDLTSTIVTAIREMRHKGVSIMIASQDPPSLPNEIIELSSILIMHKFNSPQWLKHIQKSITPASEINANDLASLAPGEAFIWATKSTDKLIMTRPIKIFTRPRVTKHGGSTVEAI
ncbi:MAG: hypothetical protein Q8K64_07665 [Sediminibacterium sp.]|nr:hypothetical protein [Sediminibacterium sp.]